MLGSWELLLEFQILNYNLKSCGRSKDVQKYCEFKQHVQYLMLYFVLKMENAGKIAIQHKQNSNPLKIAGFTSYLDG